MSRHTKFPLRRIIRSEMQGGRPFVVLVCNHAEPGKPESRYSRFYPCSECHRVVEAFKARK
jgi:hypothetical protein